MRKGNWITEATWRRWFSEGVASGLLHHAPGRLYEWLLGSLILGPILALVTGFALAGLASVLRRRWQARRELANLKSPISNGDPR